jgi:hypothetical protein
MSVSAHSGTNQPNHSARRDHRQELDLRLPGELTEATLNGRPVNVADIPTDRRQRFTLLCFGPPPQVPR